MGHRLLASGVAAALLGLSVPAVASPVAAPAVDADFDRLVAAAKSEMMARPAEALKFSSEALQRARTSGAPGARPVPVATAEWLEGEALLRLNRLNDARPLIDQALATVAALSPNTNLHGRLMMARGNLLGMSGQPQAALQDFQTAYHVFGAAKEPRGQAMALQNIGSIYQDAGDYPKALQYYAQSAEAYQADPALLVSAHNNIGRALTDEGKFSQAIDELRAALTVAEQMQSPVLRARILTNLASAEVKAGRVAAAEAHVAQGLSLTRLDPGAAEWRPYLWGVAAQAAQRHGDTQLAAELLGKVFAGVDLDKTNMLYRDFHRTASEVYARLGDDHQALAHLRAYKRLDDEARALAASTNAALVAAQFDFANEQSRIAALKAAALRRDVDLVRAQNLTAIVLMGALGVLVLMLGVGVESLRRSRNQIRETNRSLEQAVRARTEFLATTSHEIRTPLNGILGMTQVILADPAVGQQVRERVGVIHAAGQSMLAMVSDILDMAKIESGNLVIDRCELELPALLESTRKLWAERAEAKGLVLEVRTDHAPRWIVEDEGALKQVLSNLISNAIKFTDRGSIVVSASAERERVGEVLVLRVADTGIGIPPDSREQIFEAFRQVDGGINRRFGGTGLGLAICRRIVATLGGKLEVESTVGEGSSFTLRLPLERGQEAKPSAVSPPRAAALGNSEVLVIDANPLNQSLLGAALKEEVASVHVAGGLSEALATLAIKHVDLVIADGATLAREAGGGVAAASQLAAAAQTAHLAVLRAADAAEPPEALHAAGVAQLVTKPISAAALVDQLRAGFAAKKGQARGRRTRRPAA